MDLTVTEISVPYLIVQTGRGGKRNRVTVSAKYRLLERAGGMTEVELTVETVSNSPVDKLFELLGKRRWTRKKLRKSLKRLTKIIESPKEATRVASKRTTVAGKDQVPGMSLRS